MTGQLLQTARLVLRPLDMADAPEVARLIGNWNVIRWLTSPPWPYVLADAESYLSGDGANDARAITVSGALIGVVGLHPSPDRSSTELGYWLGEPFWGHGYMTEAVRACVADYFLRSKSILTSGYLVGNAASAKVLRKNGFRETDRIERFARPLGQKMPLQQMQLTPASPNLMHR